MNFTRTLIAAALIASGSAAFAQAAITQNMAVAGNVTPGDTAGFPRQASTPATTRTMASIRALLSARSSAHSSTTTAAKALTRRTTVSRCSMWKPLKTSATALMGAPGMPSMGNNLNGTTQF